MTTFATGLAPVIERYGLEDAAINVDERPWIPMEKVPGVFWQPVRFDVANGSWSFIIDIRTTGQVGRHQHHGPVFAYVLSGSWYYKEYDWVARAGAVVHEAPGAIHTLCSDEGTKTLFQVHGAMDFFDEEGNRVDQETVFYFVDQYEKFCAANGLDVDRRLFY